MHEDDVWVPGELPVTASLHWQTPSNLAGQ